MGHGEVRIAAKRYLRAVARAGEKPDRDRTWATPEHQKKPAAVAAIEQAHAELTSKTGARKKWDHAEDSEKPGMLGQALGMFSALMSSPTATAKPNRVTRSRTKQ
jgi:hypothetical protein